MAKANVLLLKHVENLGSEGEQVQVAAGYFRNYLSPKKFAIVINAASKSYIEKLQKARLEREQRELEANEQLAARLRNLRLAVSVKTGEGGKLFGSVTV